MFESVSHSAVLDAVCLSPFLASQPGRIVFLQISDVIRNVIPYVAAGVGAPMPKLG